MKHTFFYNIYVWAVCLVLFALPAGAQHIRVVPQQVSVRNDSLQLLLDMDLEAVNVSASTAVIFTPQLLGPFKQLLSLPPVIIGGGIRERPSRTVPVCRQRIFRPLSAHPRYPAYGIKENNLPDVRPLHLVDAAGFFITLPGGERLL